MAYKIERVDVWIGSIVDKPGGVAKKLAPLAEAGAALDFALARRDKKGKGLVFVAPIKGAAALKAAKKARLAKSDKLQALRIEGPDKAGLGAQIAGALADAGINMRGLSGSAIARRCLFYLAFDNRPDANKAKQILAKAL